jgi:cobalt-zinc-cadmium efflux system protein
VVEAVGGWLANSLALLSDAGHMLTDAGALGLSLWAIRAGKKPASSTKTFGHRRIEVLAALANGLALWVIVGVILHEAFERVSAPQAVDAPTMMAVAAAGLVVNLISISLLHGHHHDNLNVKGAFLHVVADSLGSVGAIIAALVIWTTGYTVIDPLISRLLCTLILWSSWGLVRESVHILLLGVPSHIEYREVEQSILANPDVCCLYDLHIWTISSGVEALSAHVVVADDFIGNEALIRKLEALLATKFAITHTTIQLEQTHEMKDGRNAVCSFGDGSCDAERKNSGNCH